jgi:hypothetical protein
VCLGIIVFMRYFRRLDSVVISVPTVTTDTSSKQGTGLDEEVQLHVEFKRRCVLLFEA